MLSVTHTILLINTTRFLLVSSLLFLLYEGGVFLYYRFVKEGKERLSKNELRKRKEMDYKQENSEPVREATVVTPVQQAEEREGWEQLIGYQRQAVASLPKDEEEEVAVRRSSETESILADLFSQEGEASNLQDPVSESCPQEPAEKESAEEERRESSKEAVVDDEMQRFFSGCDYSNMSDH